MAPSGGTAGPKSKGLPSTIKNKMKRGEVHAKVQHEKKKEKKKRILKRRKDEEKAIALGETVRRRALAFVGLARRKAQQHTS